MLTTGILVCLAVVNLLWTAYNFVAHRGRLQTYKLLELTSDSMKADGIRFLQNAKQIAKDAALEQQHAFCHTCGRIVTRHTTQEGRTTCVNCATDILNRAKKSHA